MREVVIKVAMQSAARVTFMRCAEFEAPTTALVNKSFSNRTNSRRTL